jgi:leucyl aminopeptidase
VDVATLTGACSVIFGERAFGVMGTSSNLIKRLIEAGEYTSERCWELPLWEEYDEDIKDETADLKNIGNGGAGTIIGGKFLANFIKGYPWVHMDIASTAWITGDKGYFPKGPTAVGTRLLIKALRDWKAL